MILYPLYIINFKENIKGKDLALNFIVVLLILFVSLIFQSLVIENGIYSGKIGNILVESLNPFIGNAGLYIFVLVGFIISFLVIFENKEIDVINIINKFKPKIKPNIKRIENINTRKEKRKEGNVQVKESGNIAEITIEDAIITPIVSNTSELSKDPESTGIITEINQEKTNENQDEKIENNQNEAHGIIVDELEENKKLLDEIEIGSY